MQILLHIYLEALVCKILVCFMTIWYILVLLVDCMAIRIFVAIFVHFPRLGSAVRRKIWQP
jgi:hypothetical protein